MRRRPRTVEDETFATFFTTQYPAVLAYARRRTDHDDALDIASETFLVAWRRFDVAAEVGLPWLLGTARNILRNSRRSMIRSDRLRERLTTMSPTSLTTTIDHVELDRRELVDALMDLDPIDRELLFLVTWEDLAVRDAATVVGITANSAGVRLHRARARLRDRLAPTTPEPTTEGGLDEQPSHS